MIVILCPSPFDSSSFLNTLQSPAFSIVQGLILYKGHACTEHSVPSYAPSSEYDIFVTSLVLPERPCPDVPACIR
jgi:hypothetical protein